MDGSSATKLLQGIRITFESLDIEPQTECEFDALDIYDGTTLDSPRIGRYCGRDVPRKPLLSTSSSVLLNLHSDDSLTGSGFWLNFNASDRALPACVRDEPDVASGTSGTILAEVDLGVYGRDVTCHWKVVVPEGKVRKKHQICKKNVFACHKETPRILKLTFVYIEPKTEPCFGVYSCRLFTCTSTRSTRKCNQTATSPSLSFMTDQRICLLKLRNSVGI